MSLATTKPRVTRAGNATELALLDKAWSLLNHDRWPEVVQDAAWGYACGLIIDSFEGEEERDVMTRIVITALETKLNDAERNSYERRKTRIGRAVREKVVMASYLMREQLHGSSFPFRGEFWHESVMAVVMKDCNRCS